MGVSTTTQPSTLEMTKESIAAPVSRGSFTSTLTRELERNADLYWELVNKLKRKPNHCWTKDRRFTIEDIHDALNIWERDLIFIPSKVRFTDHACEPTELTPLLPPLLPPRPQTARIDLNVQTLSDATNLALPMRPPVSHATLPYSDTSVPQAQDYNDSVKEIPIDLSPGEFQTVRLVGFPPSTTKLDLIHWLEARLSLSLPVSRIGPMVTSSTATTTVTFTSVVIAKQALAIRNKHFHTKTEGPPTSIEIENHFLGLTCLYLPARPSTAPPNLDLILVHGAHGHAINSFTCHFTNPSREALWALDALPKALEAISIVPRIMTYRWNANSWVTPQANVRGEYDSFVQAVCR